MNNDVHEMLDWSTLPTELTYLRPAAEAYDVLLRGNRFNDQSALESIGPELIKQLSIVYNIIESKQQAERLSVFLESTPWEEKRRPQGIYWPIFRLFSIFDYLASQSIEPFVSRSVKYWTPDPPLEWDKLPMEIRYLGEFAELAAKYEFDDEVAAFVQDPPEDEMEQLASVGERIRLNDHPAQIFKWLDEFDPTLHAESRLVGSLLNLLNEAGFPIED